MLTSNKEVRFPRIIVFALVLGIVVPSACVLWFMLEAMNNEQLASRQRILDVYKGQVENINVKWNRLWVEKKQTLRTITSHSYGPEVFRDAISKNIASSVIIYDKNWKKIYPNHFSPTSISDIQSVNFYFGQNLEFKKNDFVGAISFYEKVIKRNTSIQLNAWAYQAWARCLQKLGDYKSAYTILTHKLTSEKFNQVKSPQGRMVTAAAYMNALDIINKYNFSIDDKMEIENKLFVIANNYENTFIPSQQRFLIMNSLPKISRKFDTYTAESIANQFIENTKLTKNDYDYSVRASYGKYEIDTTEFDAVWHTDIKDIYMKMIFLPNELQNELDSISNLGENHNIKLTPPLPFNTYNKDNFIISIPVGDNMPGWKLNLYLDKDLIHGGENNAKVVVYLWVGILLVFSIVIVFFLIVRTVFKREKIMHLKNDLMDSVTHELKTPLSSIRMFVEILIDSNAIPDEKSMEYLHIIDKENRRLTRLIDNFLIFSRLENHNQAFSFSEVRIEEVIRTVVTPAQEKHPDFSITFSFEKNIPAAIADFDMLVLVVTNLVDNAYKYSEKEKWMKISLSFSKKYIDFEVEDKGIGLSRATSKKIFDRFYRENRKLSQSVDGCGLGLNISKYIIDMHGGRISVTSELGVGSIFSISIPRAEDSPEITK